jgi:hypothetical protein
MRRWVYWPVEVASSSASTSGTRFKARPSDVSLGAGGEGARSNAVSDGVPRQLALIDHSGKRWRESRRTRCGLYLGVHGRDQRRTVRYASVSYYVVISFHLARRKTMA